MKTRRRIHRRVARQAPKVRRCACGSARDGAKDRIGEAGGLMIGGAKDPAEAKADARASHALAGGPFAAPPVRRQCAACAAEETAQRSPAAGVIAPGGASARASKAAETAVSSLGPGRPLSGPERAFYEPRLGADFAPVRLHEDATADKAATAMDAQAFTLGRDIAFARGERTRGGTRLMAHELAHVADDAPAVRRKIKVAKPGDPIPRPKGKGLKQTNRETIDNYLQEMCEAGTPSVTASGEVKIPVEDCVYPDRPETGCDCICELIDSPVTVTVHVRDEGMTDSGPHAKPKNFRQAEGGKGSGSTVVVPSPNDTVEYGFATISGAKKTLTNWEILAHELCAHARLAARGTHPRASIFSEVRHGHEKVVPIVNEMRKEKGLTDRLRGASAADPYCGESFKRKKGETVYKDSSSKHLGKCKHLRKIYVWKLKMARLTMPAAARAALPKLKKKYHISERLPAK